MCVCMAIRQDHENSLNDASRTLEVLPCIVLSYEGVCWRVLPSIL